MDIQKQLQTLKPIPLLCCELGLVCITPYLFSFLCSRKVRTTTLIKLGTGGVIGTGEAY